MFIATYNAIYAVEDDGHGEPSPGLQRYRPSGSGRKSAQ